MGQGMIPPTALPFVKETWSTMDAERLRSGLMQAIVDDPQIGTKSNISVVIEESAASGVSLIALIGQVADDRERNRVEQVVRINTRNEVAVNNQLEIAG